MARTVKKGFSSRVCGEIEENEEKFQKNFKKIIKIKNWSQFCGFLMEPTGSERANKSESLATAPPNSPR